MELVGRAEEGSIATHQMESRRIHRMVDAKLLLLSSSVAWICRQVSGGEPTAATTPQNRQTGGWFGCGAGGTEDNWPLLATAHLLTMVAQ